VLVVQLEKLVAALRWTARQQSEQWHYGLFLAVLQVEAVGEAEKQSPTSDQYFLVS